LIGFGSVLQQKRGFGWKSITKLTAVNCKVQTTHSLPSAMGGNYWPPPLLLPPPDMAASSGEQHSTTRRDTRRTSSDYCEIMRAERQRSEGVKQMSHGWLRRQRVQQPLNVAD